MKNKLENDIVEFGGEICFKASALAKRWDMKPQSLANWRVSGKGPQFIRRPKGDIVYSVRAVEAWEKLQVAVSNHNVLIR